MLRHKNITHGNKTIYNLNSQTFKLHLTLKSVLRKWENKSWTGKLGNTHAVLDHQKLKGEED